MSIEGLACVVLPLLLAAVLGAAAPARAERRVIALTAEQLTQQLVARFPQKRCLLAIVCVTLTDPDVRLRAGDPRLFVTARARPDLGDQPMSAGTVEMAGRPRYEPSQGAFYIDEPAVLSIDFPGLAPAQAATAAALARGLLTEYLRQTPVWVLDERDARQALARLALRQVEVRDGALRFTIGDDE